MNELLSPSRLCQLCGESYTAVISAINAAGIKPHTVIDERPYFSAADLPAIRARLVKTIGSGKQGAKTFTKGQ